MLDNFTFSGYFYLRILRRFEAQEVFSNKSARYSPL